MKKLFFLSLASLPEGILGKKCECKYEGGFIPESTYKDSTYANLSKISIYGTTCAAWDAVPGTPIFQDRCAETHKKDWCDPAHNFCQAPWCYVDADCDGAFGTDVFEKSDQGLYYSYSTCGARNCYTDKDTGIWADEDCTGNPWDPFGDGTCRNEKPNCACIFRGSQLDPRVYKNTSHATRHVIEAYGTTCAAWDNVPNAPLYDDNCKEREPCDKSWCAAPWCYVDKSCPGSQKTHVFSPRDFYYSYNACGAVDCFDADGVEAHERCPWNPDGKCESAPISSLQFELDEAAEKVPDDDESICYSHTRFKKDVYAHCIRLRPGLFMYYGKAGDFLRLGLHAAEHSGWSAVALSGNGGMKGAHQIVVRMEGGKWVAEDRHSEDYMTPALDEQQDVQLVFADEVNGDTSWGVLIPLSSCDPENDELVSDIERYMLWALGTGHAFHYHMANRGSFMANLISGPKGTPELPEDIAVASFKMSNIEVKLSAGGSSPTNPYKCQMFDLEQLLPDRLAQEKASIIAIEADLDSVSEKYVHHIIFASCHPDQMVPDEQSRIHEYQAVAQHNYQVENCEDMVCMDFLYAWAVGGKKEVFPKDVGMPVGEAVGRRWMQMQMHYYNPTLDTGVFDSSGLKLTFKTTPTLIDAGMMSLNAGVEDGQRPFGIPPGDENTKLTPLVYPSHCTENWEHDELNIISVSHHAHLLGKKHEIHVIRGGEYQGLLRNEPVYDFNHQSFVESPVKKLKKGDELVYDCTFNTKFQTKVTTFGDFTETEMCMSFVLYYPLLELHGGEGNFVNFVDGAVIGQPSKVVTESAYCPMVPELGYWTAAIMDPPAIEIPKCFVQGDLDSDAAKAAMEGMESPATSPSKKRTRREKNKRKTSATSKRKSRQSTRKRKSKETKQRKRKARSSR